LREKGFVRQVTRTLELAGLPPEALIVEVTESALIVDYDVTVGALFSLSKLGVAIALDDFGTGYSSLSYLQRLPVHILKIDRSFVSGATGAKSAASARSAKLVRTIVELGLAYGLDVVAEGIEDEEQLRALVSRGCRLGQGYHLGRPVYPEAVLESLGRQASN
jgi:EAL domain-containing protein (putative c-di-GMP-specific phosphodiesterase class I)